MKSKWSSQRGLTLTEVLVASVVVLMAFGALLSTFLTGRFINTTSQHYNQAMSLARARAEYLKSLPYTQLLAFPEEEKTETGLKLDERDDENTYVPCDRITELTEENGGITITVGVTWQERSAGSGNRTLTYQVTTWVCSPRTP